MDKFITQNQVDQFELLHPLLQATYFELQELSKKKPESPLNTYKVKTINRVIEPLKELLKDEPVFGYLDVLISDDLPTNSDVVLILSQYKKAMGMFQSKYYDEYSLRWAIAPIEPPIKRKK